MQRIRKPTLKPDHPEEDVGVSREPTTTTIAPLEDEEEETAEINDETVEEAEAGEAEPFRTAPNPISPPTADVEEHRLTH